MTQKEIALVEKEKKNYLERLENESSYKGTPFCETNCDICNKKILVGGELHIFVYPKTYVFKKLCKNCLVIEVTRICPEKLPEIINPKSN